MYSSSESPDSSEEDKLLKLSLIRLITFLFTFKKKHLQIIILIFFESKIQADHY